MWTLNLRFYVPGFAGNEGNAIAIKRKLVGEGRNREWKGTSAFLEEGTFIGPSTVGTYEDPPVALGRKLYWADGTSLCKGSSIGDHCTGALAGREGYSGIRVGRGDTARYGWVRLEVDTTSQEDSFSTPAVVLHDHDLGVSDKGISVSEDL